MKTLFIWVLMSVIILAQDVSWFNAHKLVIMDNSTGAITSSLDIDIKIKLTDESFTSIGKTTMIWTFYGPLYNSTETSFYSYALDQDGVKCRIWLKAYDETNVAFGIEYSDYSFLYSCTYDR